MRCPECGVDDDRVVDSRPAEHGGAVRRRRSCGGCGARFSTLERPLQPPLDVRKRSGESRPFDPVKIVTGIDRAANGRLGEDVLADVAASVERSLRATGARVVTSEQVEGPEDFEQELVELSKDEPPKRR